MVMPSRMLKSARPSLFVSLREELGRILTSFYRKGAHRMKAALIAEAPVSEPG
jgi:hypothetical protein